MFRTRSALRRALSRVRPSAQSSPQLTAHITLAKVGAYAMKGGPVFVELMPLLARRTVLITVGKVDDPASRDCVSMSYPLWQKPTRNQI